MMKYNVKNACERNNSLSLYLQRIVLLFLQLIRLRALSPDGFYAISSIITGFTIQKPGPRYYNSINLFNCNSVCSAMH